MKDPKSKICPLPFTQLCLHPGGTVTPCCLLEEYVVGDFRKQTLEKIWNSKSMQALRQEFIDGTPVTCKTHIEHQFCNMGLPRMSRAARYSKKRPFPPARLDLMLNGRCNLECVMCDVWKKPNDIYTKNGFWEEGAENIFPDLKEVSVKGGEPFIQKDVFRLIDEISTVNPKCRWLFTTNGHYKFTPRIESYLDKIDIAVISVSIDSLTPEVYSRIRQKGELATVMDTLGCLIKYNQVRRKRAPFQLKINLVLQKDNWRELPDFVEFARRKKLRLFVYVLRRPARLSLLKFDAEAKAEVLDDYLRALARDGDPVFLQVIRPVLATLPPKERFSLITKYSGVLSEAREKVPSVSS